MTGSELKTLRTSRKVQSNELADVLEVSRMSLYRYEQMDQIPAWLQFAVAYVLGNVAFVQVDVDRTKKKIVNNLKPFSKMVKSRRVITALGEVDERPADYQGGDY